MKIFYRISDQSYKKVKLPGATKKFCLQNFLECFPKESVTIIADNCDAATLDYIYKLANEREVLKTALSNAGSFRFAFEQALNLPDEERIYFVEDDYIHRTDIDLLQVLNEGLDRFPYVTLFDHPDKYQSEYAYGESCYCFRTKSTHWRTTLATCMTFSTKAEVIKEDKDIWLKHTEGVHPHDFYIFCDLHDKCRDLGLTIPGLAYHTDLTYPLSKDAVDSMLEPWVTDLLEKELMSQIDLTKYNQLIQQQFSGFQKLAFLDALRLM